MAKKSKRQARRTAPATSTESVAEVSAGGTRGIDRNFNPDYSYVIKDLKRIGLLAGIFFGILIILSFIL